MNDPTQTAGLTKRALLRKLLGVGVGMGVAAELIGQTAPAPRMPPRYPFMSPPAVPPHLSTAPSFRTASVSGLFDVRAFGATGNGKTLDTPAINKAIEAAAAAGGGTVLFPAGTYLCYSIHLKSNITLYLDQGATILAAEPPARGSSGGYDPPEPNPGTDHYEDFGHRHWHNALIWGVGLENISILGPGLIWGKGLWRMVGRFGYPGVGDKSISLKNCHNVVLRDFSILQGGHFGILATGVDNFTVDNLIIDTNRDGMDLDCCQNVRVTNCTVNSPWDDGICPKSSHALGYVRVTKNLTISNCFVTGGYQLGTVMDGTFKPFPAGVRVSHTGRIKCGTESNGGFQNITITNCVFDQCQGLALETVDGALLEDVSISNITMRHIYNLPIFLRLGSRMRAPAGTPVGRLRRINISNIVASHTAGRYASIISGIPGHDVEHVRLNDISILSEGGGAKEDAAVQPPEKANGYPEPTMFGPMPAYGFFIRHARDVQLSNIEIRVEKKDFRPAFVLDDVKGADFIHVKAQPAAGVRTFALANVSDFSVNLSRPVPDTYLASAAHKAL